MIVGIYSIVIVGTRHSYLANMVINISFILLVVDREINSTCLKL